MIGFVSLDFFFKTMPHYVAQAGLELLILLPPEAGITGEPRHIRGGIYVCYGYPNSGLCVVIPSTTEPSPSYSEMPSKEYLDTAREMRLDLARSPAHKPVLALHKSVSFPKHSAP